MDTNWTPVVVTTIYYTVKWCRIREVALLRDSYTCQNHLPNICEQRATMVNHIVPIAEVVDHSTNRIYGPHVGRVTVGSVDVWGICAKR